MNLGQCIIHRKLQLAYLPSAVYIASEDEHDVEKRKIRHAAQMHQWSKSIEQCCAMDVIDVREIFPTSTGMIKRSQMSLCFFFFFIQTNSYALSHSVLR